jgi:hypothetical protein
MSGVQALPSVSQLAPFDFAGFVQTPVDMLHTPRVWHWSGVGHVTVPVPVQTPLTHASSEQALPSVSQPVPSDFAGFVHEPPALQVPAVWHELLAGQLTVPVHTPPWHESPVVHDFPSLQVVLLATGPWPTQPPVARSHVPAVWHVSGAGHVTGVVGQAPRAVHVPGWHRSGEQSAPGVTVHVPVSHVWQVPQLVVPQQWLPTQKPDWHSLAAAQNAPGPFWPHWPLLHTLGETQSLVDWQALLQAVPSLLHL